MLKQKIHIRQHFNAESSMWCASLLQVSGVGVFTVMRTGVGVDACGARERDNTFPITSSTSPLKSNFSDTYREFDRFKPKASLRVRYFICSALHLTLDTFLR